MMLLNLHHKLTVAQLAAVETLLLSHGESKTGGLDEFRTQL